MSLAVEMTGIVKRFGTVTALDSVDLAVERGTIHAVVGENGAGKTTLMRVLYGALQPDEGNVKLDGERVSLPTSQTAIAAGVGMVSQHYAVIPELTALQNLILGAEGGALLDLQSAEAKAKDLATKMGFAFQWHRSSSELSPAAAQKLEILKLLWRQSSVMILDEPTAMLSPADSEALFKSLHQLAQEGRTIILVTHRLPEVLNHCQTVTVLRDGRLVATSKVAETNGNELARLIVGGDLPPPGVAATRPPGLPILTCTGLTVKGSRGNEAVSTVSFVAREGEIVGIAGVDGSGQRELFHALIGTASPTSGSIVPDLPSTKEKLEWGMRVIPEDRVSEGVIESWTLERNAALGLQRLPRLSNGPFVDNRELRNWAEAVVEKFKTRHGGLSQPMASLSGGNQQRFVAARAVAMAPKLILAFQPARGLDLGATADVYRALRESAEAGAAVLVVSFDLDELLEHCDRILVMNKGILTESSSIDRDEIGRLMVGVQ